MCEKSVEPSDDAFYTVWFTWSVIEVSEVFIVFVLYFFESMHQCHKK